MSASYLFVLQVRWYVGLVVTLVVPREAADLTGVSRFGGLLRPRIHVASAVVELTLPASQVGSSFPDGLVAVPTCLHGGWTVPVTSCRDSGLGLLDATPADVGERPPRTGRRPRTSHLGHRHGAGVGASRPPAPERTFAARPDGGPANGGGAPGEHATGHSRHDRRTLAHERQGQDPEVDSGRSPR